MPAVVPCAERLTPSIGTVVGPSGSTGVVGALPGVARAGQEGLGGGGSTPPTMQRERVHCRADVSLVFFEEKNNNNKTCFFKKKNLQNISF